MTMSKKCSYCDREIKDGDTSYMLIDSEEWWLHLYDGALVCKECNAKRMAERAKTKVKREA